MSVCVDFPDVVFRRKFWFAPQKLRGKDWGERGTREKLLASPERSQSRATEILIVAPWLFDNTFGPCAGAEAVSEQLLLRALLKQGRGKNQRWKI